MRDEFLRDNEMGKNYFLDENVEIGYTPARNTDSLGLIIGKNVKIRSGTVIYLGSKIGDDLKTDHNVVIRE